MEATTQLIDDQEAVVVEQKNIRQTNQASYFGNMQLNHLIKKKQREQTTELVKKRKMDDDMHLREYQLQ